MSEISIYDTDTDVVLTATFTQGGVPTDPLSVTCKIRTPDDAVTSLTVTQQSIGVYQATFLTAAGGTHWYRFEGAGTVSAAHEDSFIVRDPRVT